MGRKEAIHHQPDRMHSIFIRRYGAAKNGRRKLSGAPRDFVQAT